jgi:peptide/nickel transport system permease protein
VTISCLLGIILGCVAGYYGDLVDNILMRIVDIMLAIPNILLALSIVAALGTGFFNLMLAIGIGAVPGYARIVRASILSVKEQEFVEAARATGASDLRIIMQHILPNCMAPIIVQATMSIANAVLSAAALSFIGLGINPPTPEWGAMLSAGRSYIRDYWFVVTFPGLAIMITVFAFNLFGDGLRDALDPRLKS